VAERIVSLLPSATEVLWFLGLGDRVVGVTFECNEPAEAAGRPHVTDTIVLPGSSPAQIDQVIRAAMAEGRELYHLDRTLLASLDPDLIVAQDLCRVCALPSGDVARAVAELGCRAEVFSYDPMTLDGVLDEIERLGSLAGASQPGVERVADLRLRLEEVRAAVAGRPRPRVLLLEWTDPPFTAGHWIPDQIVAAGGEPLLAHAGARSSATSWDQVAASGAEILLVAPCGFDQAGAEAQLAQVVARPELARLPATRIGATFAIDADAYVVRPGPRLVDGVERMAALFHPDAAFPAVPGGQ
jgi:iron complex transport system substrate-binding protein